MRDNSSSSESFSSSSSSIAPSKSCSDEYTRIYSSHSGDSAFSEGPGPRGRSGGKSRPADDSRQRPPPEVLEHRVVLCPSEQVGQLIGLKGATLKRICRTTGCKVMIDENQKGGSIRTVNIHGQPLHVSAALAIITGIIAGDNQTADCHF